MTGFRLASDASIGYAPDLNSTQHHNMSEETKNTPSGQSHFPIHIGIKMATENQEELKAAWAEGKTPMEWNGNGILRISADLGASDENGRITFVYDFRNGDLLGIHDTIANEGSWSASNPVHCTQLDGNMDTWDFKISAPVDWDREQYLAAWQRCAASSNWTEMEFFNPADCTGERFKQIYNNNWLTDENVSEDDPESLAPYDSFAALYQEAFDKLDDDISEQALEEFELGYPKPKAWCVDEPTLANVVRAVLGALILLRAQGIRGWSNYEQ